MKSIGKRLELETKYLPDGVTGYIVIMDDGTASICLTRNGRYGYAFVEMPPTVKNIEQASAAALKQLRHPRNEPALGASVTKIDHTTGQFWLNDDLGPFRFESKP
jgi:hypothetical protein